MAEISKRNRTKPSFLKRVETACQAVEIPCVKFLWMEHTNARTLQEATVPAAQPAVGCEIRPDKLMGTTGCKTPLGIFSFPIPFVRHCNLTSTYSENWLCQF